MAESKIVNGNTYTDYNSTGNYHIRVCRAGNMVTVSGIVFGKGTAGYLMEVTFPTPAFFVDGNMEYASNAVVFTARNQQTGAYQQMRVGGAFRIYRESSMTNGQPYAFAFSYCAK